MDASEPSPRNCLIRGAEPLDTGTPRPDDGPMAPDSDLDQLDFALQELPGRALHDALHGYRARGPIAATHFLGLPPS